MIWDWAADICNKLIVTENGKTLKHFELFITDQYNELINS